MLWTKTLAVLSCLLFRYAIATDVMAHFMMQNAYAYDGSQWEADITLAKQMGIDGFVLNWVPPHCGDDLSWQTSRMDDAYAVASLMGFKMMQSFDMSYAICNQFWTVDTMADQILKYDGYYATYRWNQNILVSTFKGEDSPYGNQFFQDLKNTIRSRGKAITLAPALTIYSYDAQLNPAQAALNLVTDYPSIDGYMNWQAWPLDVASNMTTTADQAFQNQLRKSGRTGPYIMAISPWQFKDLNDRVALDAWVQYSDYLFPKRWQSIVGPGAFVPDMVEILTWNDWLESHYLRNLPSQDQSAKDYVNLGELGSYVNRMNHAPWRAIATYYISWLKTGSPPSLAQDQVVVWYRTHPKGASCWGGSTTAIRNAQLPVDGVFVWAAVGQQAVISATVGSNKYWTFTAYANQPTMGMIPFPSEVYNGFNVIPEVAIVKGGVTTQVNKGTQNITSSCSWQNYNPEVFLVGTGPHTGL